MKKLPMIYRGLAAFALFFGVVISQSDAAILHDTAGGTLARTWLVGALRVDGDPGGPPSHLVINHPGDSFVVTGGDFVFESATLGLLSTDLLDEFGGGPGTDYTVRLWGDNGTGTPDTTNLLETFTVLDSDSLSGDVTLNSVVAPILTEGSTYWITAGLADSQSHGSWRGTDDFVSLGRASGSNLLPLTWFASGSTDALALRITGTPVSIPEPTSLILVGAAMLLGSTRRMRRQ